MSTMVGRLHWLAVSSTVLALVACAVFPSWAANRAVKAGLAEHFRAPSSKAETLEPYGRQLQARSAPAAAAVPRLGPQLGSIPQFSSSIFLGGHWDWMPYNETESSTSRCTEMVDRAANYTISQVQFVPTFYWVDEGPLNPPPGFDPTCKASQLDSYYCFNRFNATRIKHWCYQRDGTCPPVNDTQIATFVKHLRACMQHAVSRGLDIAVNARVDDGLALGGWRNTLDFNPLQPYGNYSYLEAVLYPLADAVRSAMGNDTRVDFEMQGEMGATAFFYPRQWTSTAQLLSNRLLAGAPPERAANVRLGLGMNNNKLCGCINVSIVDAREYLGNFSAAYNEVKPEFDLESIRDLFTSVDFVGLSAYVPMPTPWFEMCQLEGLMERFDEELAYYNLTLRELSDQGVEIHWTEFGLGGGCSNNGDCKAMTAEQAAYFPWWGVWGEYSCNMDPWMLCNPDLPSPVRDYNRYYYNQTAAYLEQGGCNYRVDAVYVWNLNSWDVLAIYPLSTSKEGSYRDPVIAGIINSHNALAGARSGTGEGRPVHVAGL